jgi:hypothetical protein
LKHFTIKLALCSIAGTYLLCGVAAFADPVVGQLDDFQSGAGTWQGGGQLTHTDASKVITTGGPAGAGDQFLQIDSSVGSDDTQAAPRLLAISSTPATEWGGNFVTAGVTGVTMDLMNPNSIALTMRVAFRDGTSMSSPAYVTNNAAAFTLPADGQWHHVTFNFIPTDMTTVGTPGDFTTFLESVQEFRIVDSATASYMGDQFQTQTYFDVDNIQAVPEPAALVLTVLGLSALVAVRLRRCG